MRSKRLPDVLRELREDQERGFLKLGGIGRYALEHEGEELRPTVVREDAGGELGDGVAELLGDGFDGFGLDRGEEEGLEGGLGVRRESGPEVGVVAGELLAEEDGGHGACLLVRGGGEQVRQLQGEGVGIGLLAEVEERLRVGALLVGGRHQVRD